ncbi:I78 family peptidase inhibitor [Histidinibacterium lentulum]|nr:I78 family peptidase inhibitor [Histidinibacterium lentulum]
MPPLPALPEPGADLCDAGSHVRLIGQDATALERVLLLGQVRVIRPGDAVTMDLRPERINFEIGEDGRIARIFCG